MRCVLSPGPLRLTVLATAMRDPAGECEPRGGKSCVALARRLLKCASAWWVRCSVQCLVQCLVRCLVQCWAWGCCWRRRERVHLRRKDSGPTGKMQRYGCVV